MARITALCAVALILLGALAYSNSLDSPFIYDDFGAVRDNVTIRRLWPLAPALSPPPIGNPMSGRPLVNLSLALNYAGSGLDPRGYHLGNLTAHVLCALLLFAIVRRSLAGSYVAPHKTAVSFVVSSLWMVHPLETEPVDHIAARTESIMALCYLFTLYTSIRAGQSERHQWWWTTAAVASCAAGMASKESMVTAPLMVVLYDLTFRPEPWRATVRSRWSLYAGLGATWLVLIGLNWSSPRGQRLGIWPSDLVLDYGFVRPVSLAEVAPFLVFVLTLIAGAIAALVFKPRWGFLGAWVFVTLAPTSSLVPIHTEVGAERRMYVPMMAIICALVLVGYFCWQRLRAHGRWGDAVAAMAVVSVTTILVSATRARNAEYASPLIMWQTVVDRWPHGRAHSNLAVELKAVGRRDEEMNELKQAIVDYPEARFLLGVELLDLGRPADGISQLQAFIRERPGHFAAVTAHGRLADAFYAQHRFPEAIREYGEYLARRPDVAGPWTNLGISLATMEQPREAVRAFERAAAIEPGSSSAHRNLANALLDIADYERAVNEAEEACRLSPQDAVARQILELARARRRY